MSFWDGNQWVDEAAPHVPVVRSRVRDWAATTVMLVGLSLAVMPFASTMARTSGGHADAACSLAAMNLGNTDVVQITATGLPHKANFEIYWTEPQITQTQYYWSTNQGMLQDTVLNNQGPGSYGASVWWRSSKGDVWEADCSLTVW
jgi:hypothetical protein